MVPMVVFSFCLLFVHAEVAVVVDSNAEVVTEHLETVHANLVDTSVQDLYPASSVLETFLKEISANVHGDISHFFAAGVMASFSKTLDQLSSATFLTPVYLVSTPNSVVAKVPWKYTLASSGVEYVDGSLVIVLNTNAEHLITTFDHAHDDELFISQVTKPKPATTKELFDELLLGLDSFSYRESVEHVSEKFQFRLRGVTSLVPDVIPTSASYDGFRKLKDDIHLAIGSVSQGFHCVVTAEDENTVALHCSIIGKYNKAKFCVDALITAESEDSKLTAVDVYVIDKCEQVVKEKKKKEEKKEEKKK